jgi:hypothetical protein
VPAGFITATENWWDAANGPSHASNPGSGVPVSNHVLFNPWLDSPPAECQTTLQAIQGRVARVGDSPVTPDPLPGVTLVLNGSAITTTNSAGNFSFNGLAAGQYTVQPFLSGYSFSPMTWTVNLPPSATGLAFVGTAVTGQTFTVRGRVVDRQGLPVPGVTILANDVGGVNSAIATTGGDGSYTLTSVPPGTYVLTPVLTGYSFTPSTRQVLVSGNVTGQDFVRRDPDEVDLFLFLPQINR